MVDVKDIVDVIQVVVVVVDVDSDAMVGRAGSYENEREGKVDVDKVDPGEAYVYVTVVSNED